MLKFYLPKKHPCYNEVRRFVDRTAGDIPTYEYKPPKVVPSIKVYLANEFFEACNETRTVSIQETKNERVKFFRYYLEETSLYRYVLEYVRYPLGLAVEYLLHNKNLKCPISGERLVANGGANASWCDLTCAKSKVHVEVKTKSRIKYPKINGGSFRWYKAQENAGFPHYLIIVPRHGGHILQCKIKHVSPSIDGKFCAFYNSKYRRQATLRSYVTLQDGVSIGTIQKDTLDQLDKKSSQFMRRLAQVYFGSKARKIQRLYKNKKKKN